MRREQAGSHRIEDYFAEVPDPRIERTKRHQLLAIITIATACSEARAEDFRDLPHGSAGTVDGGHGRIELRQDWTMADPELLAYRNPGGEWAGLRSVGLGERERRTEAKTTRETW